MITKAFASKMFEAFSIQRWNDVLRPTPLILMDNIGLQAIIAYIIGKKVEKNNHPVTRRNMAFKSDLPQDLKKTLESFS